MADADDTPAPIVSVPPAIPPRPHGVSRWLRSVPWQTVGTVVLVKAALVVFALASYHVNRDARLPSLRAFFEIWNRWDAPHYIDIAREGYQAEGPLRTYIVFYPLLPWLTRAAAWATGDYVSGALLVGTVMSFGAALALRALARVDEDEEVADRAVWFMLIFPTAYVLHIGYTEGLFLALAAGSFLAARRDRWLVAGALAALACLTRVNGVVLVGALGIEALWRFAQTRRWDRRWLGLCLGPVGTLIYLWINERVYGDPLAFSAVLREGWSKELTAPWTGLRAMWDGLEWRSGGDWQLVAVQEIVFTASTLVLCAVAWVRCRPSYAAYMTGNWLLFTSTSFVLSVPRYALILFPMYLLFARAARSSRLLDRAITVWSLLFYGLFVSEFIQGRWAF